MENVFYQNGEFHFLNQVLTKREQVKTLLTPMPETDIKETVTMTEPIREYKRDIVPTGTPEPVQMPPVTTYVAAPNPVPNSVVTPLPVPVDTAPQIYMPTVANDPGQTVAQPTITKAGINGIWILVILAVLVGVWWSFNRK